MIIKHDTNIQHDMRLYSNSFIDQKKKPTRDYIYFKKIKNNIY